MHRETQQADYGYELVYGSLVQEVSCTTEESLVV